MKRFILMALVAVMSLTASAQVYLGGSVGLWRDYNENETSFNLTPEVGYNLSDKWAIGLQIGYQHQYAKGVKANGFGIKPYGRWSYAKVGPVRFFLDMGFGFDTYKTKVEIGDETIKSDPFNAWEIGVSPGLAVAIVIND